MKHLEVYCLLPKVFDTICHKQKELAWIHRSESVQVKALLHNILSIICPD
jgi:hypothetical protein